MSSLIIHGQGKRDKNLDAINIISAFDKIFIIVIDAYSSKKQEVDRYVNKLSEKIGETGDIKASIIETCPQGVRASLILSEISFDSLKFISIGDCRIYLNDRLLTKDDSVAWNLLYEKGKHCDIIPNLVRKHPRRNILTNFISEHNYTKPPPISNILIQEDDSVTFSTDGFWEVMHDEIKNIDVESLFYFFCENTDVFDDNYSLVYVEV